MTQEAAGKTKPQKPALHGSEGKTVEQIAASLVGNERAAILGRPGADWKPLVKMGLAHWGTKPGYRFPTIKLNNLGHAVRKVARLTSQGNDNG